MWGEEGAGVDDIPDVRLRAWSWKSRGRDVDWSHVVLGKIRFGNDDGMISRQMSPKPPLRTSKSFQMDLYVYCFNPIENKIVKIENR